MEAVSSSTSSKNTVEYLGAKITWPPQCPDDILDDAIMETKKILIEHKPDNHENGQKVSF